MEPWIEQETEKLRRSWDRHDAADLRDYLVASVEDPRLNIQSILTRHYVTELLFGDRFAALQREEIRFGMALTWLVNRLEHPLVEEDLLALRHALHHGLTDAEGEPLPAYLPELARSLPSQACGVEIPNYLDALLQPDLLTILPARLPEAALDTFARCWRQALAGAQADPLTVLEPACGSANDYRFLASFGLAPWLDYAGFDLCEKNVANARALFPAVNFAVGNALAIPAADRSHDLVVVHDLFEHLSPPAMEVALDEVCRVARHALCLNFFQMHEGDEHLVRPVDDYHWNTLSLDRVRERIESRGFRTQALHLGAFLAAEFNGGDVNNPDAYTIRAWRE